MLQTCSHKVICLGRFAFEILANEIPQEELESAWPSRQPQKKSRQADDPWPSNMPLYCRGCSEKKGEAVEKPLKDFPDRGGTE